MYIIIEDNCSIESFTPDYEDKICNNIYAKNYNDSSDNVDNSFCNYNDNVICHRPTAENYASNIKMNNVRCPDENAANHESEEILEDNNNTQSKNDLEEINEYCGEEFYIENNNIKKGTNKKTVKKCSSVKACKYIENKICKYPMSNTQINSLKSITNNDSEFNSLIKKTIKIDSNSVDLEVHELLPDNLLTVGPHLSSTDSENRKNLKNLYIEIFNNDGSKELNIWDINGKIEYSNLKKKNIIDSYLDNSNKIISRKGYNLSKIPKNYYELVYLMRKIDYHVSLAVNNSSTKYAIGIGKTKSEAADVALIRCTTFITSDVINELSKKYKNALVNRLHQKLDINKKSNIVDLIKNIFSDKNKISNDLKDQLTNDANIAKKIFYLTSHEDIFNYLTKNHNYIPINNVDSKLNDALQINYNQCKIDNINDICGILMINDYRYINVENVKDIKEEINCDLQEPNNLCPIDNQDCQEVAVIGYDDNKCTLYQDIKILLENSDFNKLPIIDEKNDKWINEKNDIKENSKVNLILDNINKCKKTYDKCFLYKINDKVSTYNSLY